jgi:glutathione-specific gamma-glutamylcyclotransferase
MTNRGELWIFGYGSLMWRPGFAYVERAPALLAGYHRSFCITSTHHRGSPERPGLVLGLDRGGICEGIAYRIASEHAVNVKTYLRARELVNGVYREALAPLRLLDGSDRTIRAIAYIVERAHPSYAAPMALTRQAMMIRGARGLSGDNLDYLVNTVRHLQASGIRERKLERLVTVAAPHVAQMATILGGDHLSSPSTAAIRRAVVRHRLHVRRLPKADRRRFMYRMRLGGQD